MSDLEATIFDWDNTLVSTAELIKFVQLETFNLMNKQPTDADLVILNANKSMRESFPLIFKDNHLEAARLYQSLYLKYRFDNYQLIQGALLVIQLLAEANIPMFIISNKIGKTLREEIEYLNLTKYFTKIVGALDNFEDKPASSIVSHTLSDTGIICSPKVLFIGDSLLDIECAINANCKPLLYGDSYLNHHLMNNIERVIDHYELLTYISNSLQKIKIK